MTPAGRYAICILLVSTMAIALKLDEHGVIVTFPISLLLPPMSMSSVEGIVLIAFSIVLNSYLWGFIIAFVLHRNSKPKNQ